MGAKWGKRQSPGDPPSVGPYATAEWDADAGRWRTPLTEEGRRFLADWYERHGSGIGLLRHKWASVYREAVQAGASAEEIERACEAGMVKALVMWHPEMSVFPTYMAWQLRCQVQHLTAHLNTAFWAGHGRPVTTLEGAGPDDAADMLDLLGADPARKPRLSAEERAESRESRALVRAALRRHMVSERDAGMVELRYGLDGGPERSLEVIGREYGVSKERVRQILGRALKRLKRHLDPAEVGVRA